MNILLAHMWRLMLLKHNGQGLALSSKVGVAAIILLSVLASLVRWEDPQLSIIHAGLLVVTYAFISPVFAIAYALISTSFDTLGYLSLLIFSGNGAAILSIWELVASITVAVRIRKMKSLAEQ